MEILNVVWRNNIYYVTNLKRTENRNGFVIRSILQKKKKSLCATFVKIVTASKLESKYTVRVRFGSFPLSVRTLFRQHLVRKKITTF